MGGTQTDSLSHTTSITVDRRGLTLTSTDAQGNATTYVRNALGEVTSETDPDPDGSGPLPAPVTTYTYDSHGNMTGETHPDGSTESLTYDSTFNQVTSHTDQLGQQTIYTINSSTGTVTAERQVIGQVDGVGNS